MADVKETLRRVLSERDGLEGLRVMSVKESPCTKPGDNFTSAVSVADVEGILPGGVPYSNRVFLKRPMENPVFKEFAKPDQAFANEAAMYMKVLPLYDVTMPCPRCYHADKDLIILEDLGKLGYKMADRTKGLDLDTARKVIKALAMYHAASFHANSTKKDEFEKVTVLFKPFGAQTSNGAVILEGMFQQLLSQLEALPEMKPVVEILKPLQGKLHETLNILGEARKIPVLCHGDFWINNILVQEESKVPVMLVDFQQCRGITSPVVDVWPFMYTSLEPQVMNEYFEDLLQLYCKCFVDDLILLRLPADRIPTAVEVLEDLTSREFYGIIIGSLYLPVLTMDPASMPKLEDFTKEQIMDPDFLQHMMMANMKDKLLKLVETAIKRDAFNKK